MPTRFFETLPRPSSPSHAPVCALAVRTLGPAADAADAFESVRSEPQAWLLDSALRTPPGPHPPLGRYSFLGADPYLVLRSFGRHSVLDCRRAVRPDLPEGRSVVADDPLELVRGLLVPSPLHVVAPDGGELPPFVGGAVGAFGYELETGTGGRMSAARLRRSATSQSASLQPWLGAHDALLLPDLTLCFVDRLLAIDHHRDRTFALGTGFGATREEAERRAERAAEEAARPYARGRAACAPRESLASERALAARVPDALREGLDEGIHAKGVAAILDEIAVGNVYQVNWTRRLERPFRGDPWHLYRVLRGLSPAPFAAYLALPDATVLSSSPERFLHLDAAGRVESRPIKGTRPRGPTPRRDAALRDELAASAKDAAENLMIVDLVRNDLGRVCEIGSVAVPQLRAVEDYATVFQLVSSVTGRLAPGRDAVDLVRAAFPPGSMTGAPKLAAMRLIERLEPVGRGLYAGAIGYLDARGGCDLSVVIRTLVVKEGRAFFHVGGGIVWDSDPADEYAECLDKARALWEALVRAEPEPAAR